MAYFFEDEAQTEYENILTWWYEDGNFQKTHQKQPAHEKQAGDETFIDKHGNKYFFSIIGPCSCAHLLFTVKYANEN